MIGELPPVPSRSEIATFFARHAIPNGANPGLVFDRFLRIWPSSDDQRLPPHERLDPKKNPKPVDGLSRFVEDHWRQRSFGQPLLEEAHARLAAIAPRSEKRRFDSRFVSGLGASHPLENGFTFDRNIGVPMISGSSVKGLCRAMATLVEHEDRSRLFGPDFKEGAHAIGELVFLPAMPTEWPRLEVDLINCHHPRYYTGKLAEPVEVESPVPVPFLAVAAGASFVFRLLSRCGDEGAEDAGFECLRSGLEILGIGAKTAVGYGVSSE